MKTSLADFGITSEIDSMETALFVLFIFSQKSSMKTRGEIDSMENSYENSSMKTRLADFGITSRIDFIPLSTTRS